MTAWNDKKINTQYYGYIICRENVFFFLLLLFQNENGNTHSNTFDLVLQHLYSVSVLLYTYRKTFSEGMRNRFEMELSEPRLEDIT